MKILYTPLLIISVIFLMALFVRYVVLAEQFERWNAEGSINAAWKK